MKSKNEVTDLLEGILRTYKVLHLSEKQSEVNVQSVNNQSLSLSVLSLSFLDLFYSIILFCSNL